LIDIIKEKTQGIENYHLIEKAVADYNGKSTFFISGNADWGCSSLNTFNDNLEETWPGRTDFKVTDQVEVDVIRLDGFIEEHDIQEIEFFHCDTQGKDLEVLIGMGAHISKIKSGVIEMPTRHNTKLYKDQKYLETDARTFLEAHGFCVERVESNDSQQNEVNIFFNRIAPLPTPVVKKPKLAVIFAGRAFCYETTYPWFKNLSEEYDVDFYCSLNSELTQYYKKFIDLYKIKKYNFEKIDLPNRVSMFHNIKKAFVLIPADEYDAVMYARTEIEFGKEKFSLAIPDDNTIFVPGGEDHCGGLNDRFAFGSYNAMFKYTSIGDNIEEYQKAVHDLHPETTLKYHVNTVGLNIQRFDMNTVLLSERHTLNHDDVVETNLVCTSEHDDVVETNSVSELACQHHTHCHVHLSTTFPSSRHSMPSM
jgi:FkbM family methyltransferase